MTTVVVRYPDGEAHRHYDSQALLTAFLTMLHMKHPTLSSSETKKKGTQWGSFITVITVIVTDGSMKEICG